MASQSNFNLPDALRASGAVVHSDPATLDFFAHDIFARGATPAAVVQPGDVGQLCAAVRIATDMGHAVIPRGGGMSYTAGYTSSAPGPVLFDLSAMNRVVDINRTDMTVTVEPGCTWANLYETLRPLGLRTPFWGPLSGRTATVGGAMSQNSLFWGSGRHGTAANSCIAIDIVRADGGLMRVGHATTRPYGPDMVGLFLADTGALGMKAAITLRLLTEAPAHQHASFSFADHEGLLTAMAEIDHAGISTESFGFDPRLNAIRMRRDSLSSDAKALVGMMKAQGSLSKALKEGLRVISAGRDFLDEAQFSLHVLAEGRIQAAAEADIADARAIAARHGGVEVENTIPKIIRANPFGPLNSMLGPEGERWAPIHGLLPHSRAIACYAAIDTLFSDHGEEMSAHGIHHGSLIAAVGGAGVIIEPCLYWPDARNPLIEATVEPAHLAKLPTHHHDPATWALVNRLKQALIDLFFAHGAAHLQIGRTYRYADSLDAGALALLRAIKREVDPRNLMNPGALGIV